MSESGLAPVPPAPTPVAAPPQPELIAGKFKDEAAFQQGARELFKHRGVQVADNAPVYGDGGYFATKDAAVTFYKAMAGAAPAPQQPEYVDADIDGVFKAIGLDTAKFGEHLVKNKTIDDDSLKAFGSIEVRGKDGKVYRLNKDALNDIFVGRVEAAEIKAQRAQEVQEQTKQAAFKIAGGNQESYDALMRWAGSNLDPEEAKQRSAAITGGDPKAALDAVRLIKARYDEKNGGGSPIVGNPPSPVRPISSVDDLIEVNRLRRRGDKAAQARFDATDIAVLQDLQKRMK